MYKLCKSEQSAARQKWLEQGLLQMMQRRQFEEISVSDLCDQLNIPRKSFYRYFSSKDGALYSLIDHTLADFFQMPLPDKKTRGDAMGDLDLYFAFWYQNRTLLDALQRNSLSGILVERAIALAQRERLMPGYIRAWTPELQQLAMSFAVSGSILRSADASSVSSRRPRRK